MPQRLDGNSSRTSRLINAPRERIYAAFTTPEALETWQAPDEMTAKIHHFDARPGGGYEMSLFYPESEPNGIGKTAGREDRYRATFIELTPSTLIVETIRFETPDPAFSGEMTITITLEAVGDATNVTMTFDNIPPGIRPEDNDAGTRSSLEKLARYVEQA